MGKRDGSYSLCRPDGLNCLFLKIDVRIMIVRDFFLPTKSDSSLLELSGVECRNGKEFGVVKSTTFTVGFSVSIVIASEDEVGSGVDK